MSFKDYTGFRFVLVSSDLSSCILWQLFSRLVADFSFLPAISSVSFVAQRITSDAVRYFDTLVEMAQRRNDADVFLAGSSFNKVCEIALVFAQRVSCFSSGAIELTNANTKRNDVSNVQHIVRFIKSEAEAPQPSQADEFSSVQLYARFSQGATMLEKFLQSDSGL